MRHRAERGDRRVTESDVDGGTPGNPGGPVSPGRHAAPRRSAEPAPAPAATAGRHAARHAAPRRPLLPTPSLPSLPAFPSRVVPVAGVVMAGAVATWAVSGFTAPEAPAAAGSADTALTTGSSELVTDVAPSEAAPADGGAFGWRALDADDDTVEVEPRSLDSRSLTRLSRAQTERAERAEPVLPAWLRGCPEGTPEGANGQLAEEQLCLLPDGEHRLTTAAATGWWELSEAYEEHFGVEPCLTDSYRTLEVQQYLASAKPGLAAVPGTSNHGWGTAVDLCGGIESFGTPEYDWMIAHAAEFGWENPDWAQSTGSNPEPWHWEHESGADLS